MPAGDLGEPPGWLSAAQREGWRYAVAHAPPGLLSWIDRGLLTIWVVSQDLHRQATTALNNETLLVTQ